MLMITETEVNMIYAASMSADYCSTTQILGLVRSAFQLDQAKLLAVSNMVVLAYWFWGVT